MDRDPAEGYSFTAEVWLHDGDARWHFLTVPDDVSDEIEERTAGVRRGFGSVCVRVTIGRTTWATSVFPDRARRAYVLPVKGDVRQREGLSAGDRADVVLGLVDLGDDHHGPWSAAGAARPGRG